MKVTTDEVVNNVREKLNNPQLDLKYSLEVVGKHWFDFNSNVFVTQPKPLLPYLHTIGTGTDEI